MEWPESAKSPERDHNESGHIKMNLIAAVGQNLELGLDRGIPWNLPNEYGMFVKLARGTPPPPEGKKNVALIGRKNWYSRERTEQDPLSELIQIVLSRTLTEVPKGAHYLFPSLEEALGFLSQPDQRERIHEVWNIGGHDIYKAGLESPNFHRLYLTRVYGEFKHDVKFPEFDVAQFHLVRDARLPEDVQEDRGIKYQFFVYEKINRST